MPGMDCSTNRVPCNLRFFNSLRRGASHLKVAPQRMRTRLCHVGASHVSFCRQWPPMKGEALHQWQSSYPSENAYQAVSFVLQAVASNEREALRRWQSLQ